MITRDMSIGQVLAIDRTTVPIFMSYGIHCLGCPHATAESLEQAGMVHGIDVDKLVQDLNDHINKKEA